MKNKLLLFFLPVIILAVILTGLFSYLSAVQQLRENAYYLLKDTIHQTNVILNDKFTTAFEQLYSIENESAFHRIIESAGAYKASETSRYNDIVDHINLNKRFNENDTNGGNGNRLPADFDWFHYQF